MITDFSYLALDESLETQSPILVAAGDDAARLRVTRWLEQLGRRAVGIPIDGAIDRLSLQAAASGLWIEVQAGDDGQALDDLLNFANGAGAAREMPTIVAAPVAMIDPMAARLTAANTQLLIDPSMLERTTAVALSRLAFDATPTLHDVAQEPASRRLKQLSDEVGRIAATLARLSTGPDTLPKAVERPATATDDVPPVSGEVVRSVLRARRLRSRFFDEELFADPAWDMLLDLLQAEIAQHRVPVSSLCIAAAVPATTALRWIKTMTDNGLFNRRADPHDGRRVFIELAPDTSLALRRYFAEVGAHPAV
jgi:DNA-binding MarR family transcriptional regulator